MSFQTTLLSVDHLLDRLIDDAHKTTLETVHLPLDEALGNILSTPIIASINVPPFDNSAMDGYALVWQADLHEKSFPVSDVSLAGQSPCDLKQNTVVRILTGAPIPKNADTVIIQENVTCNTIDGISNILINLQPKPNANIRRAGQDVAKGTMVFDKGTRIGAAEIGLLSSLGIESVDVHRQLRVSVIATGDELVRAGTTLADGQIYNSNTPMLNALLKTLRVNVVRSEQAPDQPEKLKELLKLASLDSDIILTTGGASVGDADHLKDVLKQIGRIESWKIAIKPGKPLVWGEVMSDSGEAIPLIGLPGNPQSVWVTFLIVVLPYLKSLQGQRTRLLPKTVKVPAGFAQSKAQSRREYIRVQMVNGQLIPHLMQSSGTLMSASWADGFAIVDVGQVISIGDLVEYLPMYGLI
jgi:molybdopterin molybdotransferase